MILTDIKDFICNLDWFEWLLITAFIFVLTIATVGGIKDHGKTNETTNQPPDGTFPIIPLIIPGNN